jgi:hypothetical protein
VKVRDYEVVTRTEDGRQEVHFPIKAVNADIAIRKAKQIRASIEGVGTRDVKTISATPVA